jgi:hypothetical protein
LLNNGDISGVEARMERNTKKPSNATPTAAIMPSFALFISPKDCAIAFTINSPSGLN